ncbi:hypothetical protein [Psychromonas sp. KJ10-2]
MKGESKVKTSTPVKPVSSFSLIKVFQSEATPLKNITSKQAG